MSYTIRKTRPEDEAAVDRICYLTFDNGDNERYRELAGLRWTTPYLRYELENCFVIVGKDDVPVGYVLAAADARVFRKKFRKRMRKDIRSALKRQRNAFPFHKYFLEYFTMVRYSEALPPGTDREYPAHLHIDILPGFQGKGLGGMMIGVMIEHLRTIGCTGVHLGVGNENTGGIRFYKRYGFKLLKRSRIGVSYFGLKL